MTKPNKTERKLDLLIAVLGMMNQSIMHLIAAVNAAGGSMQAVKEATEKLKQSEEQLNAAIAAQE